MGKTTILPVMWTTAL